MLDINAWLQFAIADLDTAKLVFEETENYFISVFHSHQAVEKILKRQCILNKTEFPYVHDLISLYNVLSSITDIDIEKLSWLNKIYLYTRYPKGDQITLEDAQKAYSIAKEICDLYS